MERMPKCMACEAKMQKHGLWDLGEPIKFAETGEWEAHFGRLPFHCYLCSFSLGFEAYAEWQLTKRPRKNTS